MISYDTKGEAMRSLLFDILTVPGGFPGTVDNLASAVTREGRDQINLGTVEIAKRVGRGSFGYLDASDFYVSEGEVDSILVGWRSPGHIEEYGWTVAYVGRGNESRYVIEEAQTLVVGPGAMAHKADQVSDLIRTKAHLEFALDRTDGRSSAGKRYARAVAGVQVAIDALLAV